MSWDRKGDKLTRTYIFKDFKAAWRFASKIADLAEEKQHHPDIFISYNKVTLMLCTHDAGHKITQLDEDMADAIELFYNQHNS